MIHNVNKLNKTLLKYQSVTLSTTYLTAAELSVVIAKV
jgi:hypothetical protein